MDLNLVHAIVWLAALSVISHGTEIQCRFCFKYFLESCDGTYRIEIGNVALPEEDLQFTKHCSNEPLKNGHGIFGASFATEISGNNFPMVSGKVPGQHPDYGIEVEKGNHQEINTSPLQHHVHAEEGLSELNIHHVHNINGVYKTQLPDILIPDQDPGYSGEGSVGTGAGNVVNTDHQSIYVEGSKPAQKLNYDGQESVDTAADNININIGDNTNYQHLYPEGDSPSNDSEGLESTEMLKVINFKGKKTKRQPQYLKNIPSVQYSSLGGKGTEGIRTQHAINVEGENTIYQSQYPKDFELGVHPAYNEGGIGKTGIFREINKVGENTNYSHELSQHPSIVGEGLIEVSNNNGINEDGGITNNQPQYAEELKLVQQPNNGGEGTVDIGIHGVINAINDNTIYQPQYLETFKPDNHPKEGTVELGLHNVKNTEGENNIYQAQYPNVFKPQQYSTYIGEGSVESGIHNEINNEVENTHYQPQYTDGLKLGQHPGYGGEGIGESGMQNVIISKGKSTVYQSGYPEIFTHGQNPRYDRLGSIEIGKHNVINAEGGNTVYQPQYLKGFTPDQHGSYGGEVAIENKLHSVPNAEVGNVNYKIQNSEYFQPGQQPKEREIDTIADHAIDIEVQHYPEEFKSKQQDLKLGSYPSYGREGIVGINVEGKNIVYQPTYPKSVQSGDFPSYTGERPVVNGMHIGINSNDKNTIDQPQFPENLQPAQFSSQEREESVETGIHYVINNKGKNTVYQSQNPENFQPGEPGSVETGMHYGINNEDKNNDYQAKYPENFQPGEPGSVGAGIYSGINNEGKNTVYQPQYPENFQHGLPGSVGAGIDYVINNEGKNTDYQPQYPENFQPGQSGSVEAGIDYVINNEGKNTDYQPQYPENFQPGQRGSVEAGIDYVINNEGENTVYQPQYPGILGTEINNLRITKGTDTVNHPQYPQHFQTGQYPNNGVAGSIEIGMHNATHIEGDQTIYQSLYPESIKHYQQSNIVDNGSEKPEIINLRKPNYKNTVHYSQYPEYLQPVQNPSFDGEGSVGIGSHHVINADGENTGYQPQLPDSFNPSNDGSGLTEPGVLNAINIDGDDTIFQSQYPMGSKPAQQPVYSDQGSVITEIINIRKPEGNNLQNPKDKQIVYEPQFSEDSQVEGEQTDNHAQHLDYIHPDQHPGNSVEISVGNGIHVLIDSESKDTMHEPQHPEIFLPGSSFGEKVSVGSEKTYLKNLKGKKTVNEPQFFEIVQPSQSPANGEEGSIESGMHNVLNLKVEQSDNQEQHPVDLQLNQHPSNGVEVSIGNGMQILIDSEGKNTEHDPQYPEIFIPDSNFAKKTEDQHAINVEGENTVYQYPNNAVHGTVGIGIDNVINTEGENSIYQPKYSEGTQPDHFIGFDGSLGFGINKVKHNTGLNTVHGTQYADGSEPSQFPGYNVVGSLETGSHQVRNPDVENTVQGLAILNTVQHGQSPSYDGTGTVETGSHHVINTYGVQQPVHPFVIQSGQRPNYDGAGVAEIGTENLINIERNHAGYDGVNWDVKNIVQQAGFPGVTVIGQLPNFSGKGSVDLNSHQVTNAKGEKTVFLSQHPEGVESGQIPIFNRGGSIKTGMHDVEIFKDENTINHPQYPKNLQWGVHPTHEGESTVENLVHNNLQVVHSSAQSVYADHLHEYQNGDVPIKIGDIHSGKNLEYSVGTKPIQQPNYQSGVSSMQVKIQQDSNAHQSSYPNEKQSSQRVKEVSGGEEQSQLGDSGSNQLGSHEFEIEHEQEISYPEINSGDSMQSEGHIPGSLQQSRYPYLEMKGTPGLYQKVLFDSQSLAGLQPAVNQLGPVIYSSSGMLQGQSSKNIFNQAMAENYLFKKPKQTGVLQYLRIPSRQKVVQHIVHHHVHIPSLTAGLSGLSAIIEKQKLAACLKKYGTACKQLLENKYRNDESSKKKLLYSRLLGLYGKQLSQYMKQIPKLEQSSSAESSEQFDKNALNAVQLQALLASKKEEGKYTYAPAYMKPYMPQFNQENYQNMPAAELFGKSPNLNSYLKGEESAKQGEMKSLNVFKPAGSTEGKSLPGKIYHKIVKKIRVRTRSKIRGRISRRNNDENTEDYEDENTSDDPNEIVEYVEEEVPEDNNEENNKKDDIVESVGNSNVATEGTIGEKHNTVE